MSFYGSVYYQFIDTFYKLIIYNHKNDDASFSFPSSNDVEEKTEIQAMGRTGVIELKSGNKWIQFTVDPETNIVNLWHTKPENIEDHRAGLLYGIDYYARENDTDNKNHPFHNPDNKINVIPLYEGDYIWTSGAYYDEAGHIIHDADNNGEHGKYQVCYQLPISKQTINTNSLIQLVGGINPDNGDITTTDFKDTTVIKKVINNETEISNHDTRVKKIEDIYNGSNNFFNNIYETGTSELKNFPKYFGNIDQMVSSWSNYLGDRSNSDILNPLLNDDKYKNYISNASGGSITFATVSAIISLLPGVIDIVKKSLEASIKAIDDKTDVATELVKVIAQTVDSDIFNADNTIPETFGKNDDSICYFSQENSVAEAFGLTDNEKACYFKSGNSVRDAIENLDSKINTKVDNNVFDEYKTTIYTQTETDTLLSTKVNNSDLDSYKEEINTSLSEKVSNTTLESYKEEINTTLDSKVSNDTFTTTVGNLEELGEKSLMELINDLQVKINDLETTINILKEYHSEENPIPPENGEEVINPEEGNIPEE